MLIACFLMMPMVTKGSSALYEYRNNEIGT